MAACALTRSRAQVIDVAVTPVQGAPMPGPFTHIYAARRVADLLAQTGQFTTLADGPLAPGQPLGDPAKAAYYASVMRAYPKLASVGAIGPDLFFFLADLRPPLDGDELMLAIRMAYLNDTYHADNYAQLISVLTDPANQKAHPWLGILALMLQIDAAWNTFVTTYRQAVAPIVDGFGNLVNALTGDILQSAGNALQEFVNEIGFALGNLVLDNFDWLGVFKLIMLGGEDETSFYWSDMLHYRRTSQMAQTLLRMAEQMVSRDQVRGEQFLAYALGFACHLATDVVGHTFVNEQAGGPFRTQWGRHHLVENHLDAWVYAQTAGPQLAWSLAGNTRGFGDVSRNPFFTGDFAGSGKAEVLFYSPGDSNWWLGTFAGTQMTWTLAGNSSGFGNIAGNRFFTGDFTGSGKAEVMFYSPGTLFSPDGNWWLASFTSAGQMSWTLVGNTVGFGDIAGNPFFTGDFTGSGKAEVLFYSPGDGNWWLATFPGAIGYNPKGAPGGLSWTLAGNSSGFGNIAADPFFTGDFTGSGRTEVLFYSPGTLFSPDDNWWLATFTAAGQMSWTLAGNSRGFGDIAGNPFFTGDFTGSGKTEVMFYAPGNPLSPDGNWWLATFAGSQMSWTLVGNTLGRGGSPWDFGDVSRGRFLTGKFSGGPADEIIFSSPGGNWLLVTVRPGQLTWTLAANTAGFGNVAPDRFFTGDFTGSGRAEVMFYAPGTVLSPDGNWWLAILQPEVLPQDSFCAAIPGYPSLAQSALYFAVAFTAGNPQGDLRRVLPDDTPPHGYDSAAQLARTQALDTDGDLPDWLAQGIVQALIETYGDATRPQILRGGAFQGTVDAALQNFQPVLPPDPPLSFTVPPGFPLPWEVQTAYKLMLSFFKRAYMDDFDLPVPPAPTATTPPQWPDFGNVSGIDTSSPETIFSSVVSDIATVAGDVLNSIASLIAQITGWQTLAFREALYLGVTVPAWRAARSLRQRLVERGFLIPQSFEVDQVGRLRHPNEIDFSLITLGRSIGQPALPDPGYPWRVVLGQVLGQNQVPCEFRQPWVYPSTNPDGTPNTKEDAPTRAGAFAAGALPDRLLRHGSGANNPLRLLYEMASSPAGTDAISASAAFATASAGGVSPLGDCVQFAAYLIGRLAAPGPPPADFNLDADRGYGYLCWDWNRDDTQTWTGGIQPFHPPAGWTPVTDPWWQVPAHLPTPMYPLQLHYLRNRALTSWVDRTYQHVAYLSRDGHLHHLSSTLGVAAWADTDVTASTGEPPAASGGLTCWVDKTYQHLAFTAADGHVHEFYRQPGSASWSHADLTAATGARPAAGTLTSWVDATYQHVVCLSADGHVQELYGAVGTGPWQGGDLTAVAGGPAAASGALTSWVDATYQHVVYLSADGHLHELYFALGTGPWQTGDLTVAAAAPPAAAGALTSWVDKTYQHIAHISADGHVHELRFALGTGPWTHTDLTAAASAPAAGSGALTSWLDSKSEHVAYVSADGRVQHLYSQLGSASWSHDNVTADALGSAGALTSWVDKTYQHVVFMSGDRHVQELHNALGTATWQTTDLTTATGGQT